MSQTDRLLELSVLSYHRLSPRQVALKRFDGNGGTLGRAEHADWHLPDPERVVSSIHGQIGYKSGSFWITDLSTNGLFVNRAVAPLGNGQKHLLTDGDLLCLGDYEINVAIISAPSHAEAGAASLPQSMPASSPGPGLKVSDFAAAHFQTTTQNNTQITSESCHYQQTDGYQQTDALASNDMLDESFSPPQSIIPDDWQPQWQQTPLPDEPLQLATNHVSSQASAMPGAGGARAAGGTAAAADVGAEQANAGQCLQAFLSALNVATPPAQQLQNPAWWGQLGEALQASLQGMIDVMRSRSELKNTLRVNQTTFGQRENNPLKFSANVTEAFHNLFNHNASSFMAPQQAVKAAFADISEHEAAIIAGAAGAMQGLLAQLTPQLIAQRDFGAGFIDKVNPAKRYSRYWRLYQALHQELLAEVGRTAKGGVNDDFIRAYENYLTKQK